MKRVLMILLCLVIILTTDINVYAGPPCDVCHTTMDDTDAQAGYTSCKKCRGVTTITSDADFSSESGVPEDRLPKAKAWIAILQNDGYSDAAIASILANAIMESHWNPLASEADKNGGLFGFTPMTKFSDSAQNKSCTHEKGTAGGQSVCSDGSCQIAYMMSSLESDFKSFGSRTTSYNSFFSDGTYSSNSTQFYYDTSDWQGKGTDVVQSVPEIKSLDDFKSMTDPLGGACVFLLVHERAAGCYVPCGLESSKADYSVVSNWHNVWNSEIYGDKTAMDFFLHEFNKTDGRPHYGSLVYSWITGSTYDSSDMDLNQVQDLANSLAYSGIWDEQDFVNLSQLVETPIEFPTQDQLSKEQLQGVVDWKNNIEYENDDGFIKYLRIFVMLFGILFLVWVVLIYLSYWFDRINNFIEIEFLPIVTFNRLKVSPEENECTFNPASFVKGSVQTVNHKTIIGICAVGIFFSILTISGVLYTVLNTLVRMMLDFIGVA